jgi:multidrug efflux pump subunit AcrA (membrane-fusion protein)
MNSSESRATVALLPIVTFVGLAAGLMLRPTVDVLIMSKSASYHASTSTHEEHDNYESEDQHEEHHDDHIALSRQAYQNLKLSVSAVELSDHTQSLRMPGDIVEWPGLSPHLVSAPVSGRITKLFASPGVSLATGEPLFDLEIVDDELMDAQLRLLELLTKQEIVDAELERLSPLATSGVVRGREKLEKEYQRQEIMASLDRTRQELSMRGLSREQVDSITESRRVISTITVATPQLKISTLNLPNESTSTVGWNPDSARGAQQPADNGAFSVEDLFVATGETVARGAPVCKIADHRLLLVCGHAFENEINVVSRLLGENTPVAVELGIVGKGVLVTGLRAQHVAGHVDESSQSFHFYVPLQNEVLKTSTDALGRKFCTWKYKVGQRVHVLVPTERIHGQIVLPADAVVHEGPEAFVFREHVETPESEDTDEYADNHEDVFIEFEPVHVTIVAREKSVVVVAPGEELAVGDRVAISSAYQLHLAWKSQQEGGGGHHHRHH